jgi:hypothetical protein
MIGTNKVIILSLLVFLSLSVYDIMQFGAVPNSDTVIDQFKNQKAILAAIAAANTSKGERAIRIPSKTFYTMPIRVDNTHNISFEISGRLSASKNVRNWPR